MKDFYIRFYDRSLHYFPVQIICEIDIILLLYSMVMMGRTILYTVWQDHKCWQPCNSLTRWDGQIGKRADWLSSRTLTELNQRLTKIDRWDGQIGKRADWLSSRTLTELNQRLTKIDTV